jgi:hypothetical protein
MERVGHRGLLAAVQAGCQARSGRVRFSDRSVDLVEEVSTSPCASGPLGDRAVRAARKLGCPWMGVSASPA